jgi:hypothetical protein
MTTIDPNTSLSSLRELVFRARANPVPLPASTAAIARRHQQARDKGWTLSDLVVTREGEIRTIQETGRSSTVSRITTEVFAAGYFDEDALAAQHLPRSTTKVADSSGGTGWVYPVTTDVGDTFELFLYRDHYLRLFRVRLMAPSLEQLGLMHETHLYGDGHLCISPAGPGLPMMNNAYARSVMWCHGISLMARGHAWPWGE